MSISNRTYDFSRAILNMKEGKKAWRVCWKKGDFVYLTRNRIMFVRKNGNEWLPTCEELLAEDWDMDWLTEEENL